MLRYYSSTALICLLVHYANGLNCTKCTATLYQESGKEFASNELYCRRCGTLKRLEQKYVLHSSSDERPAIEHYYERRFPYDTIIQVGEKCNGNSMNLTDAFHGRAQVSSDKIFFSICKKFLDLGKIVGM